MKTRRKMSIIETICFIACSVTIFVALSVLIYVKLINDDSELEVIEFTISEVTTPSTEMPDELHILKETEPEEVCKELTSTENPSEPENVESTEPEPDCPEESSSEDDTDTKMIKMTDEEIYTFATAIYLEGGSESLECQKGIGSVILNRMISTNRSLKDVLYEPLQFDVASSLSSYCPDDESLSAVNELLTFGPTMPRCVTYFRAGYYHQWNLSRVAPYCCIDNTYFSHDLRLCYQEGGCCYEQEESKE